MLAQASHVFLDKSAPDEKCHSPEAQLRMAVGCVVQNRSQMRHQLKLIFFPIVRLAGQNLNFIHDGPENAGTAVM